MLLGYVVRRILYMLPILVVVTFIIFLLTYLQPGDVVDAMCGLTCPQEIRERLRDVYGLDEPFLVQYFRWVKGVFTNLDFGYSPIRKMDAWEALVGEGRWLYTLLLVLTAMFLSWAVAIPIGIYSATHKYSPADHTFTFLGFLGLSIPNFILGLLFIWLMVGVVKVGQIEVGIGCMEKLTVGEFYSTSCRTAPWSLGKVLDFLWHFLPPVLILAGANTAAVIRYMRGSLLDVLKMDYIQTARAKGLAERVVIYKHAVRNAINPLISMLGFWIPYMLEGALVIAIIFNLPQIEKTFIESLENRDYAVVMSGLFVFSLILMIGTLVADILLALSDPKIRYE
jgi:peptide/nickel transport system permease protein